MTVHAAPTAGECAPLSRCGAPQANSTTSMPRCTSPMASRKTLPCSSLITAASAFWSRSTSSRNRVRMRARRTGGVARHVGNAAVAAATAASTSAALANGTTRTTLPVAGLVTSPNRTLCVAVGRPLIQRGTDESADGGDVEIVVLMIRKKTPGPKGRSPGPKGPGLLLAAACVAAASALAGGTALTATTHRRLREPVVIQRLIADAVAVLVDPRD